MQAIMDADAFFSAGIRRQKPSMNCAGTSWTIAAWFGGKSYRAGGSSAAAGVAHSNAVSRVVLWAETALGGMGHHAFFGQARPGASTPGRAALSYALFLALLKGEIISAVIGPR